MSYSPNPGGRERWRLLDIGERMEFKKGYLPEANSESDPPDLPITKMEIQRGAVTSLDYILVAEMKLKPSPPQSKSRVPLGSPFCLSSSQNHQSTHL